MTKETLLKYDWFIDNEFLDAYLDLVNNVTEVKTATDRHHIIPACWYKARFSVPGIIARKIADCDPLQEIVVLTIEQHLKAHELLLKCTTSDFNERLQFAYNYMQVHSNSTEQVILRRKKSKQINEVAKKLRKDCHYVLSWEDCKKEAKLILAEEGKL